MRNPFETTKAVELEDHEIGRTYVDFAPGGARMLADPSRPMAQFILGWKGGGRTHLLRYFSYPLQKERAGKLPLLKHIKKDGYLGIYLLASGLNSRRFDAKGLDQEAWDVVYAYYMDVWLVHELIKVLLDLSLEDEFSGDVQRIYAEAVYAALGYEAAPLVDRGGLDGLLEFLTRTLQSMDRAINAASLGRSLEIDARSRPGELIFEACRQAQQLPGLSGVRMTFLIDELENLTERQQIYVNTLIREKDRSTGFLVGSRLWGFRTRKTWSAEEENKLGSEFVQVVLEDSYRAEASRYEKFCLEMVSARLRNEGVSHPERVRDWFPEPGQTANEYALDLVKKHDILDRPYQRRLRTQLETGGQGSLADSLVDALSIPSHPELEKLAILQFYRDWWRTKKVDLGATRDLGDAFRSHISSPDKRLATFVGHWRVDMLAQLASDTGNHVRYQGWNQYVEMAGYLPRGLLVILRNIIDAAGELGERPLEAELPTGPSFRATNKGVRLASEWYALDSKPLGTVGSASSQAIDRLGSFLRSIRFSSRPLETTCSSFTVDRGGLSADAMTVLETCVSHGLLVKHETGRRDRNSAELLNMYQIHPMLAPRFDLPTARRGNLALKVEEANAIFGSDTTSQDYASIVNQRVGPLTAPFRGDPVL